MYSHEIEELLKLKNYLVSYKEYIKIIESPQVDHINYINGFFEIWTNDGYSFKIKVLKKEE